jgi:tetratricopeptide (TPR) repeat protein
MRLVQWEPVQTSGEVLLFPRAGRQADLAARIGGVARLSPAQAQVYVGGVNIDGGTIDVGEDGQVVQLLPGTLEEISQAAHSLVGLVEPARFLVVQDAHAQAFFIGDTVVVEPVSDWATHLAERGAAQVAIEVLLEGHDKPRAEHLPDAEAAVRLSPDTHWPRAHLGWLLMRLGHFEKARVELERAIAAEAPDHAKAYAWANLGWSLSALGRHDEGIPYYKRAIEGRHIVAHRINLGVVCMRGGHFAQAWEALRPYNEGRTLFEAAQAMAELGRFGDARALLRAALETQPSLLDPVPENQWPKPPDVSWAAAKDDLVDLVDAAEKRDRG